MTANNNKTTPAAVYLRMSDDDQKTSIEIQRRELESWAVKSGYRIVSEYIDEGKSGSMNTHKRKEFLRMIADADQAEWRVILVVDMSRFGRLDTLDGALGKRQLRDAGVKLHCKVEGIIDWSTPQGRIIDAVLAEAQHDYSIKVSNKTLGGKLNKFLSRKPFGARVPYAMARKVWDDQGEVARVIPRQTMFRVPKEWSQCLIRGDEGEVQTVQWLFATFVARDVGFRWLASQLNEQGKPSPNGGKWCDKIIENVITNEKYAGDMTLGKRQTGKFFRLTDGEVTRTERQGFARSEGLTEHDTHDAIIDRDTFDKVQAKVKRRKHRKAKPQQEGGYALTGVLYCGQCGKPLYGNPNNGVKKSGRTKYVCKQAVKYGKQCECAQWGLYEDEVLPFLQAKLSEGVAARIVIDASEQPPADPIPNDDRCDKLRQKIDKLSAEIEQGSARFLLAPPELTDTLAQTLRQWRTERDRLQAELATANTQAVKLSPVDKLRRRQAWFAEMQDKLLRVSWLTEADDRGRQVGTSAYLSADALRELLVSNGCRVDVWWGKSSAGRWEVSRVQVRLFDQATASFPTMQSSSIGQGAGADLDLVYTGAEYRRYAA